MKKILFSIVSFLILIPSAFSGQRIQLEDEQGRILGTSSSNPIHVNCVSGCGGSSGWTLTDGSNTVTGVTNLTVTGGTVGGVTPNGTLTITGGSSQWTTINTNDVYLPNLGNVGIGTNKTTTSALTVMNGNVGIGTWVPSQILDVNGTIRATQFVDTSLTASKVAFTDANKQLTSTGNGTSSQFIKGDNTLDSNTYLTANQTITLSSDVTGSGTTAITATLKNTGTAGTYRSTTFDAQGRETSGTNPTTFSGYAISDTSANLATALTDEVGTGFAVFNASPNFTGNVGIGTVVAPNTLYVAGTAVIQSNVGIGTGNPGQILDVQGTIRGTNLVKSGGTSSQFLKADGSVDSNTYLTGTKADSVSNSDGTLTISPTTGAVVASIALGHANTWTANQTISAANIPTDTTTGMKIGTATNQKLGFFNATPIVQPSGNVCTAMGNLGLLTSCTESAGGTNYWINNSGNVGINTTYNVGIGTNSVKNALNILGNIGVAATTGDSYLTTAAPSGGAIIEGNVGIGSVNPGAALDVNGNARVRGTNELFLGNDNLNGVLMTANTGGDMQFVSNGINVFRIFNGQNVGINTTANAADLNVTDNTSNEANFIDLSNNSTGGAVFRLATDGGAGTSSGSRLGAFAFAGAFDGTHALPSTNPAIVAAYAAENWNSGANGTDLRFGLIKNGGTTRTNVVYFMNSGNVGIGTSNPQEEFVIGSSGSIRSDGTAPTVANNDCGSTTQGTVGAGSTDIKGSFVVGTLTVTSCAVTFSKTLSRAPVCVTQDDTNILGVKTTTTTTKMTTVATTSMSGDTITYICIE